MNETTGSEAQGVRPEPDASIPPQDGKAPAPLLDRVKNILLSPRAEWERIDGEPATVVGIYRSHVLVLAAIPAAATMLGLLVFGYSAFGISYRPPLLPTVFSALVQYALTLGGVYLLALVIDLLAPKFDATPNRVQAFKVAAYSATAAWVAGIFGLLPALSILSILGLYSLYLLYLGLPRLMRAPQEKALSYTVVVVIVMIVLGLLIGVLTTAVTSTVIGRKALGPGSIGSIAADKSRGRVSGEVKIPGVGSINLGKLDEMARSAQAQGGAASGADVGRRMEEVLQAPPVDSRVLDSLLPDSIAGLPATDRQHSTTGAGGISGARAQVRYDSGGSTITLRLSDMAIMRGMGALTGVLNMEQNRQTANGYERMGRVNGRMTTERWDRRAKEGNYSILVGDRVLVEALGRGVEIDQLKAAVHGLDIARLEREIAAQ